MKMYERVVDSRLKELVPISQEQFGFMPDRSATDAIFIGRQVMEKYREGVGGEWTPATESNVDGRGKAIEKVQDFRYLGSDIAADGSVDWAVKSRINAAWMKWRESIGILCGRRCSRTLKRKVYRTVVRPTMLYCSQCWPVSKSREGQLHSAEMGMLRWACGWTRLDRVRSEDVRTAMQTAPVQLKMRKQHLRLFGRVLRNPQSHPIRETMEFEAQGKRPRGTLKTRWLDLIGRTSPKPR
ncbi:hypothetical protein V3C99_003150 [Haemonchus contortus]